LVPFMSANDDVELAFAGVGTQAFHLLRLEVGVASTDGVEIRPVPSQRAARGASLGIAAPDPDRDARSLNRGWREGHLIDAVVLTRKCEGLAGPQARDDRQFLVEHFRTLAEVEHFAEMSEARVADERVPDVACADAEDEPAG